MNSRIICRRESRRIIVDCPAAHPLAGSLVSFGFHYDESKKSWWRGYNEAEEIRVKEAIAAHEAAEGKKPKTQLPPPNPALIVKGDTYPVRNRLKSEFRCRFNGSVWVAPDRKTCDHARLAVALESLSRLGLPRPKDSVLYPPPTYIIAGPVAKSVEEAIAKIGAHWIADWGCWSIDGTKEQVQAALAALGERHRPKEPANGEPPLSDDAFRLEFHSLSTFSTFPKGMKLRLDDRPAVVVASGITPSDDGSPSRHWAHLTFEPTSPNSNEAR